MLIIRRAIFLIVMLSCFCGVCSSSEYNVGAYYYPWYAGSGFHGGPSTCLRWHLVPQQQPELGWYNDRQPSTISSHFLWARGAGIDFFACSYWGVNSTSDVTIRNYMFPNPDKGNMKLAVFLETAAITQSKLVTETNHLCDNYFKQPSYYRIDGKPVILIYLTLEIPDTATPGMSDSELAAYTNTIRTTARNKGIGEVYLIGDEVFFDSSHSSLYRLSLLDAITGYDVYGSLHWFFNVTHYASQSQIDGWTAQRQGWKALANSANKAFIPVVAPGFNDTAVRVTNPLHPPLSRKLGNEEGEPGSLFRALIEAALPTSNCNSIMVTSWNEWHEDTQIEPVAEATSTNIVDGTGTALTDGIYYEGYGTLYLDILRELTSDIPAPPVSPGSADIDTTSIRWTWVDKSSNETGFKIYANTGSAVPITFRGIVGANQTSWTYTGLVPNMIYSFQAAATNNGTDSLKTPNYSAVTFASPPSVGNSVQCTKTVNQPYVPGTDFTFTNPAGFGSGAINKVTKFKYAWDTNPTHTWTESELSWNSGSLSFTPSGGGSYYLHLKSYNSAGIGNPTTLDYGPFIIDTTPPSSSATPDSGVYNAPVTVQLSSNEPGPIYYTTDGSAPTTLSPVYSSPFVLNTDATVRFFAVDNTGNTETPLRQAIYYVLAQNGRIPEAKTQPAGSAVRLGGKILYWKSGNIGYISEEDRSSGVRIQGTLPPEGVVNLIGTLERPSGSECYVSVGAITRTREGAVKPLGTGKTSPGWLLLSGLYTRTWGIVKYGSVTSDSFILDDGTLSGGIKVSTTSTPGLPEGRLVIVTGAMGFDGEPVIYAKEIVY